MSAGVILAPGLQRTGPAPRAAPTRWMIPAEWMYCEGEGGRQVPMPQHPQDPCAPRAPRYPGTHLQPSKQLVDEELDVLVAQRLALDDVVQVGAHQGGDQVPG